ncbi:hypothetical protein [Sphingomonas lycopersici]|uniref:Uncharacterized protein n=1 Tax=Sphingomonas lycopersici TaxID=2951807 RepID=A0AA41ZKM2_9SPHN|nr:hypothetical protein [Sphingomonas lycopersici]MCW6537628.1 hypothetical protein [Sphingomonas lycopersici]
MLKTRFVIAAGALVIGTAPALAQHGHGGGGMGAMPDMSRVGGNSWSHMSTEGRANSNGPNAVDRDRGAGRADDRRSAESLAHNNQAHTRHKRHKHLY